MDAWSHSNSYDHRVLVNGGGWTDGGYSWLSVFGYSVPPEACLRYLECLVYLHVCVSVPSCVSLPVPVFESRT